MTQRHGTAVYLLTVNIHTHLSCHGVWRNVTERLFISSQSRSISIYRVMEYDATSRNGCLSPHSQDPYPSIVSWSMTQRHGAAVYLLTVKIHIHLSCHGVWRNVASLDLVFMWPLCAEYGTRLLI